MNVCGDISKILRITGTILAVYGYLASDTIFTVEIEMNSRAILNYFDDVIGNTYT